MLAYALQCPLGLGCEVKILRKENLDLWAWDQLVLQSELYRHQGTDLWVQAWIKLHLSLKQLSWFYHERVTYSGLIDLAAAIHDRCDREWACSLTICRQQTWILNCAWHFENEWALAQRIFIQDVVDPYFVRILHYLTFFLWYQETISAEVCEIAIG